MTTPQAAAIAVNLLFGAKARQPNEAQIKSYIETLSDRTPYQIAQATSEALRLSGDWVVPASRLREMAGSYDRTEAAMQERQQREREALRLEHSGRPTRKQMEANRQGLRDDCKRIMAGSCPEQAAFCRQLLAKLDRQPDGANPLSCLAPTIAKAAS